MKFQTHLTWPVLVAIGGFFLALIYAIRYKIPDISKRLESLEKACAKTKDVSTAIDSFSTVCKFKQVSCQKQNQAETAKMLKDLSSQMAEIYEKLNHLAVSYADVAAKVEIIFQDRAKNSEKAKGGKRWRT